MKKLRTDFVDFFDGQLSGQLFMTDFGSEPAHNPYSGEGLIRVTGSRCWECSAFQ